MVMRLTVVWVRLAGVGDLGDLAGTYDRHPPCQALNLTHDVGAEEYGRAGSVGFTQADPVPPAASADRDHWLAHPEAAARDGALRPG